MGENITEIWASVSCDQSSRSRFFFKQDRRKAVDLYVFILLINHKDHIHQASTEKAEALSSEMYVE